MDLELYVPVNDWLDFASSTLSWAYSSESILLDRQSDNPAGQVPTTAYFGI